LTAKFLNTGELIKDLTIKSEERFQVFYEFHFRSLPRKNCTNHINRGSTKAVYNLRNVSLDRVG
jgi:hypothetical protein